MTSRISHPARRRVALSVGGLLVLLTLALLVRPEGPWGHKLWPAEAIEPHVAASGTQLSYCWMEVAGAGEVATAIAVQRSQDGGETFGPVEHVAAPGERLSADPTLAFGQDGTLYLSWLAFRSHRSIESEPFDMAIVVATAGPGSKHFGPPQLVAEDRQTTYDKPWSTVDSEGVLHVVYRAAWGNRAGLYDTQLFPDGHRQHRILVEEPGFSGALPVVCSDPAAPRHVVAYLRPERGIELRVFDTASIGEGQLLSQPQERVAHEGPSCVFSQGQVFVSYGVSDGVWDSARSPLLRQIVVARRAQDGGIQRHIIETEGELLMHPQLLPPSGQLGPLIQLGYLAGRRENDPAATLRLATLQPGLPPAWTVETLRDGLQLTAHREDRRWPGDYLGAARLGERAVVAYIDNHRRRQAKLLFAKP